MYIHPSCDASDIFQINALFSCFENTFNANYSFEGERHDFWECVLCLDGAVEITADERVFTIYPGQIVFHKPMQFHRISGNGQCNFTTLIFSFRAQGEGMRFFEDKHFLLTQEQMEPIQRIQAEKVNVFSKYLMRARPFDPLSPHIIKAEIELLLLLIMRQSGHSGYGKPDNSLNLYKNIMLYLEDNIDQTLSLEKIAKDNALSVSSLKKIFHRHAGEGIINYFNKMKITYAKKLLAEGRSIAETSELLGYSSQGYFTVSFKRETGFSPSVYKKSLK